MRRRVPRKFCYFTTHLSALKPAVLGAVVNFAISTQTDIKTSVIQKKKEKNGFKAKDIARLYRTSVTVPFNGAFQGQWNQMMKQIMQIRT